MAAASVVVTVVAGGAEVAVETPVFVVTAVDADVSSVVVVVPATVVVV